MTSIFLDFDGIEVKTPSMYCSNLKKYEKYELELEDEDDGKMYYLRGLNLLDNQIETFSNITVLKDFIDIGETVYKIKKDKHNIVFADILSDIQALKCFSKSCREK